MNFLTEEQTAWRESVEREVGREYIRKRDMERSFLYQAYEKATKLGFHRLLVPEADGGGGGDVFSYALMCEALSKYGVNFCVAIAGSTFTAMNVARHGTPEQKKRFLEPFMRGEIRFPISMSEPGAGSDVANVQTRAERAGDGYVINGQKLRCSSAAARGAVILMLVRTAKAEDKREGLSVFIVPNDTPGLTIRPLRTLARRSVVTTEIFLDNVRGSASSASARKAKAGRSSPASTSRSSASPSRQATPATRRTPSTTPSPTRGSACSSGCRSTNSR